MEQSVTPKEKMKMETNFNFNSKICTTMEQSERLLHLGLKRETADMIYVEVHCTDGGIEWSATPIMEGLTALDYEDNWLPAWSLHRLIKLAYGNWDEDIVPVYLANSYDMLIGRIKFQIKQGKFNKEYLV